MCCNVSAPIALLMQRFCHVERLVNGSLLAGGCDRDLLGSYGEQSHTHIYASAAVSVFTERAAALNP